MRVTREQIKIFNQRAHQCFGEDAVLWLFGSRVDDRKKAGITIFWSKPNWAMQTKLLSGKLPC